MTTLENRPNTALLVQVIAHTNLYWTYHAAPGRTAGAAKTEDVDFGG